MNDDSDKLHGTTVESPVEPTPPETSPVTAPDNAGSNGTYEAVDSLPHSTDAVALPSDAALASADPLPPVATESSAFVEAPVGESSSQPREARMKIGSQRGNAVPDMPAAPRRSESRPQGNKQEGPAPLVTSDRVPHTVDIPNLRSEPAEDVEALIQAAMGESSVEQLVATGSAPIELEVDMKVRGRVASIHQDTVFFDLPGGQQGAVPQQKFKTLPVLGSEQDVVIKGVSTEDGVFELALPGATIDVSAWDDLQEGGLVEAKITGANIGGLECNVAGIRGFIPASQISIYRVENLSEFIGQKLTCLVVEAKRSKRNLVLSRRAILEREQEESRKALLESLTEGEVREGTVRSMRDFGAFIDLGGIDGLVHVRQLSWERIKHPNEVLEIGQKIKVKVERINPQTGKITLLFRDLAENPWSRAPEKYAAGSKVKGTVSKIAEFGAFVKLEPGVEGLIHISELAHGRVFRASDVVKEGQEIETKVLNIDPENQRISLSLKALLPPPVTAKKVEEEPFEEPDPKPVAGPPRKQKPLKGGISRSSGGEQFGLRW